MPHPRVAAPCPDCACPSCPCRVCLTVTGCGIGVTADWGVYTASDCSGTPIVTGHYDGATPSCFCLPASGIYYIAATPTGAASSTYRPRCYLLDVTDEDCAGEKVVGIALLPYKYTRGVCVYGCDPNTLVGGLPTPGAYACPLEGVTVHWSDGTNSVTGTSDALGCVSFADMDAVETGTAYTITISDLPAGCGWDDPSTVTGFTGDPCIGQTFFVHPTVAAGYECIAVCGHPFKTSYTLSIYGGTVTLNLDGLVTVGAIGSTAAYYYGCGSMTCATAIKPKYCDTNPAGYRHRYEVASDTIPFIARLWLYPATGLHDTYPTGQPCGPQFTAHLEIDFASAGGLIGCELETPDTFPTPLACGPIGSFWCVNYPGGVPTWTTGHNVCSGDNIVSDSSCEGNVEAGSPGSIGGVGCASYVYDEQVLDCLPCPFTMSGSVAAEPGNSIACMEDTYTIS